MKNAQKPTKNAIFAYKNPRKTGANAQNSPYEHTNFSRALAVVPRQQYNIYNYAQNFATKSDFTCVYARNFPYAAVYSVSFLSLSGFSMSYH